MLFLGEKVADFELTESTKAADLVGLIHQRQFAPRVAGVRGELTDLRHAIVIDDGSGADTSGVDSIGYEEALAGSSPERDFGTRSGHDR